MKSLSFKFTAFVELIPGKKIGLGFILVNALAILVVYIMSHLILPPSVPLFYGKPYGAEQLASALHLVIPPLAAIVLSAVNVVVSRVAKDEFINNVLFGAIAVVTLLSLITIVKIIFLVGNINVI